MAENNVPATQPKNKVALTSQLISSQTSAKAVLELPEIETAWIKNYQLTTGKADGALKFNQEKVLFLKRIEEDNQLKNADKFSLYVAFTELAISGGTLRDGICYVVAFGKKAQFLPGWKFRLEQIDELPAVVHCHQPQAVYDCDEFSYEKGMRTVIHKHIPSAKRTESSKITHVYFVVEFQTGPEVYIMEAIDVLKIRNQYSKSWKSWVADCAKAQQDPEVNKPITVKKSGQNGEYTATVDPSMWIKDEAEAFKKTIIHRAWKAIPGKLKRPKDRLMDERLKGRVEVDLDPEDLIIPNEEENVDTETGEVKPPVQQPEQKPEPKAEQPAPETKPGPADDLKAAAANANAGF
jgi:recombinational DNA repair protein RecT